MWHLLDWFLHVSAWAAQVAWLNFYYIAGFAGFARIAWMVFHEGRRYQLARVREMLARVRESRRVKGLPATVAYVERDAA